MKKVDVVVPNLGESIAEASVSKICKKVGDQVNVDELLFELETDKATMEVNALCSGIVKEITVAEGDEVEIGSVIALIEESNFASQKESHKSQEIEDVQKAKQNQISEQSSSRKEISLDAVERLHQRQNSPAANLAMENRGIKSNDIVATGKNNRITKYDVLNSKISQTPFLNQALEAKSQERVVPMTKLRQKIAKRLKESQNTAAMLTTFNEVDMQRVMSLRSEYKESFEKKHGVKLGFMSFFVKAAIAALKEFPEINAQIRGTDIIYKDFCNIGVAVGSANGLVVPVLKNAEKLSMAQIEKEITSFGKKAKENKLKPDDMQGGTFTLSNGGIYGSLMSTPIINPPQSGILGMHSIKERPVVINKEIKIRPMMYLALSYDHRIVDGKEAVTFLVRIKNYIENPERLVLDV